MKLLVAGNQLVSVSPELAAKFKDGDVLHVARGSHEVLHVPAEVEQLVRSTVDRSCAAFAQLGAVSEQQISGFFAGFAERLRSDATWREILLVNQTDVDRARGLGRSTTRLVATDKMRAQMVTGLEGWVHASSMRGKLIERVEHTDFAVELVGAELGVVGFVFEGRPNVVADATGVLRGGNAVVFRIGSDALGTARAILDLALRPALEHAGLPRTRWPWSIAPSARQAGRCSRIPGYRSRWRVGRGRQ
jgi:glutamate-5-semialdehyde dehydrogenase